MDASIVPNPDLTIQSVLFGAAVRAVTGMHALAGSDSAPSAAVAQSLIGPN